MEATWGEASYVEHHRTMGHRIAEIIDAGLCNTKFIEHATTGFEAYRESVEPFTLDHAERITGVPGSLIRELAHEYARADRAEYPLRPSSTSRSRAMDSSSSTISIFVPGFIVRSWAVRRLAVRAGTATQLARTTRPSGAATCGDGSSCVRARHTSVSGRSRSGETV